MAFTNSSLVNYTKISPNRTKNRNHAIDTITIHCVVGQCTVESLGNVFAPVSRQASSNYGVGRDGRIGMYCEEKDRSWCTSSASNDHRAITIEVASDTTHPYAVTDAAYNALIKLVADICKRNGIKKLLWKADKSLIGQVDKQNMTVHRWFANKSCPGQYLYERHGDIANKVNAILGVANEPIKVPDTPTVASTIKENDIVRVTPGAKYYNGKSIPSWVIAKDWIVKEVNGDRVVIDKSVDGKNSICSAVNASYLVVKKTTVAEKPSISTTTGTASTGSAADEKKIWDFLYAKLGNAYGVAGLMGNLYAESALRSNNLQQTYEKKLGMTDTSYTTAVDKGTYSNFVKDSAGYGLAQWTYWSRKEALLKFAQSTKKSIGDFDMQLNFLWKELSENYKGVVTDLKGATTVLAASNSVLLKFERPANQDASVQAKRAEYGQKYYDKYASKSVETPAPVKPVESPTLKFSVGAIVKFAGGKHYKSSGTSDGTTVKASKAKITAVSPNGKHKYHCRAVNDAGAFISGVYGWVDESTLSAITTSTGASGGSGSVFTDIVHTVKAGETLSGIASKYGTTYQKLAAYNNIANPNVIAIGQKIRIPQSSGTATVWTPKIGDVVNYKGTVHYANANATSGAGCKGGKAKISAIYQLGKSKHPYHLIRVSGSGSTVYGWVDAGTFTKV